MEEEREELRYRKVDSRGKGVPDVGEMKKSPVPKPKKKQQYGLNWSSKRGHRNLRGKKTP